MIERERRRIHEPGNGIDASSPLPDKLCELEKRISAALTEPRTAAALFDLLEQTDIAVVAASEHAKLENDKALDPTVSPDPHIARQQAEDAAFMANRLRTLRPRLLARLHQVTQQEELAAYRAKQAELGPERDALEQELATVYPDAAARIVDLFLRIRAYQQRAQQQVGDPPANVEPLPALAVAHLLDKVQLFDLDGKLQTWPPLNPFAATFAESMNVPPHPGAAWWQESERKAIERQTEAEKMGRFYEQQTRIQEERENRTLRDQFKQSQRHG